MLFSNAGRRSYDNPQLLEVICQLKFPTILSIGAHDPAEYQDAIRGEFPKYGARQEKIPPRPNLPAVQQEGDGRQAFMNYSFASGDGSWRINLANHFFAFTTTKYTSWEDFAKKMDRPLAQFIKLYKPAYFERIGLRYMNVISRRELGIEDLSFSELFQPAYLGPLAEEDVFEPGVLKSSVDFETTLPAGNAKIRIHSGPGLVKRVGQPEDKEVKFILDNDVSSVGNTAVQAAAGVMERLHTFAGEIFEGQITDKLRNAM